MSIEITRISCNSCGGALNILEGNKFCYCVYCGASYYVDYGDAPKKSLSMRLINNDDEASADFEIVKNKSLSSFLSRAINDYSLIDEGYCSRTPNNSKIYFLSRKDRLFIVEQISQFHVFEGKIYSKESKYMLQTNYLCSLSINGKKEKRNSDIGGIKDKYDISMNNYGRLSLKSENQTIEIRLCARYISEYRECIKMIEEAILSL